MLEKHSGERLFDLLKTKDEALASQLEKIKRKGVEEWIGLLQVDKGSHSGYPHLRNVEHIADQIVPYRLKHEFSAGELFLLLSAIFLHDIGKVMPPRLIAPCGKKRGELCPANPKLVIDPENKKYIRENSKSRVNAMILWARKLHLPNPFYSLYIPENYSDCSKSQWDHYLNSEQIINELGASLGLPDERIAQYCGLLAFCHGLKIPPMGEQPYFKNCVIKHKKRGNFRNTSLAPYGTMRIPLLAAILRIADETDNLWTRAVRECWYRRFQSLSNIPSRNLGKAFRRHIEDIEFSHEGECLIVHVAELYDTDGNGAATVTNELSELDIKSINNARKGIYDVISNQWGTILKENDICFEDVFIEYGDYLYKELDNKTPLPLGKLIKEDLKSSLKDLLNAIMELYLGGYKYQTFAWHSLEAQIGKPLTDVEKWLVLNMRSAPDNFHILADPHRENFRIEMDADANIDRIREQILGD